MRFCVDCYILHFLKIFRLFQLNFFLCKKNNKLKEYSRVFDRVEAAEPVVSEDTVDVAMAIPTEQQVVEESTTVEMAPGM